MPINYYLFFPVHIYVIYEFICLSIVVHNFVRSSQNEENHLHKLSSLIFFRKKNISGTDMYNLDECWASSFEWDSDEKYCFEIKLICPIGGLSHIFSTKNEDLLFYLVIDLKTFVIDDRYQSLDEFLICHQKPSF
jgi:hypothetical protein